MPRRVGAVVLSVLVLISLDSLRGVGEAQESFQISPSVKSVLGMETTYSWVFGQILVPAGGRPGSGTPIDTTADLGLDKGEGALLILRSTILERHFLNFDYLFFAPSGAKRIARTFRFQNKTYEEGTMVESSIRFNWLRGGYGYALLNAGGWRIAPRIGAHYISHGITLNGDTEEAEVISNTRRLDGFFPVVGIETRYLFPYGLDLYSEMEGIHLLSRGFLMTARAGAFWELRPDVVFSFGASARWVKNVESNQPLNNQWRYGLFSLTGGLAFTF